jgi:hypothetical protein
VRCSPPWRKTKLSSRISGLMPKRGRRFNEPCEKQNLTIRPGRMRFGGRDSGINANVALIFMLIVCDTNVWISAAGDDTGSVARMLKLAHMRGIRIGSASIH